MRNTRHLNHQVEAETAQSSEKTSRIDKWGRPRQLGPCHQQTEWDEGAREEKGGHIMEPCVEVSEHDEDKSECKNTQAQRRKWLYVQGLVL